MAETVPHPFLTRQPFLDPIPGILPFGSISIMAGASGVGKTAMMSEWLQRLHVGRQVCWKVTNAIEHIGVIVADRKWRDHRQWFEAVGYGDIKHYSLRDDATFNWELLYNRAQMSGIINKALDRLGLPPGGLVCMDPISVFMSGNLNAYHDVLVSMARLDKILTARKLTCIGIHHTSKQKGDPKDRYTRPQDRILGSTALLGYTDTPLYLMGPEDTEGSHYSFGWTPHHAAGEEFHFMRNDQGLFIPYDSPDRQGEKKMILGVVTTAAEGMPTKDILKFAEDQLGLAVRTSQRYLTELVQEGKVSKVRHGYWRKVSVN